MNDTKVTPTSGPAGGSRSQVMTGNACRLAAENLLAAMRKEDGSYRSYDEMVAEGIDVYKRQILHKKQGEVKEIDAKYLHNAQKQCYFFYELYLYDSCYSDFSTVKYN